MRKRMTVLAVMVAGTLASAMLAAGSQAMTVIDRPTAATASGTVTL